MLAPTYLPLLLFSLLSGLLPAARAQLSDATCPSSLAFLQNSKGQDPCVVLSTIFGACLGQTSFTLTALGPQYAGYAGPTSTSSSSFVYNRCLCSMPVYNLVMACETCQSKTVISWDTWTQSCNSSFTGDSGYPRLDLPIAVPDSTVFAPWVTINNEQHNWSTAEVTVAGASSTSASATSSSSAATSSVASVTPASAGTSSGSSSAANSSASNAGVDATTAGSAGKQNNTGAIVGGTVGGLALLGMIGLGALYLLRTNQAHHSAYSRSIGQWAQDAHQGAGAARSPFQPSASSTGSHQAPSASWYGRDHPPLSPGDGRGGAPSRIDYAPHPAATPMMARQYSGHTDPGMWGAPTPAPQGPPQHQQQMTQAQFYNQQPQFPQQFAPQREWSPPTPLSGGSGGNPYGGLWGGGGPGSLHGGGGGQSRPQTQYNGHAEVQEES